MARGPELGHLTTNSAILHHPPGICGVGSSPDSIAKDSDWPSGLALESILLSTLY